MSFLEYFSKLFCCWKSSQASNEEIPKSENEIDEENHPGIKKLKDLGLLNPPHYYNSDSTYNIPDLLITDSSNSMVKALLE